MACLEVSRSSFPSSIQSSTEKNLAMDNVELLPTTMRLRRIVVFVFVLSMFSSLLFFFFLFFWQKPDLLIYLRALLHFLMFTLTC